MGHGMAKRGCGGSCGMMAGGTLGCSLGTEPMVDTNGVGKRARGDLAPDGSELLLAARQGRVHEGNWNVRCGFGIQSKSLCSKLAIGTIVAYPCAALEFN